MKFNLPLLRWLARRRNRPIFTAEKKIRIRSLEFFLTDTCNLRCRQCAASSPFFTRADLPDLEDFRRDLAVLASVMECDELKLLGGEPLMNEHIIEYLEAAHSSGMFRGLRVATNGLLLHKMPASFWKAVNTVEISLYPVSRSHLTEKKLSELSTIASHCGARLEVRKIDWFREATRTTPETDSLLVKKTFSACSEAHEWSNHLLYRHRLYRCSRIPTLDRYLTERGLVHDSFAKDDGLSISARSTLRDELFAYLTSPVPLGACSFCHGTSGKWFPVRQLRISEVRSRRSGTDPKVVTGRQAVLSLLKIPLQAKPEVAQRDLCAENETEPDPNDERH